MFQCDVCGATEFHEEMVAEVFLIDGKRVLVEDIPAQVCTHCGEPIFSRATTEKVRRLVHGAATPASVVQMEVYEFA
jgi:HTH-type transcriptional regulator/antitoxin MqsA